MYYNVDGINNAAIGTLALFCNTIGEENSAYGPNALNANTIGCGNTAIGTSALCNNITGSTNVGIGCEAGMGVQCSNFNIAIGYRPLDGNNIGDDNIGIGRFAGAGSAGVDNINIGRCSAANHTGSRSVFIGRFSGSGATASDILRIGNKTTGDLIYGCFSNDTICNGGNNTAWDTSSDCRIKENWSGITNAINTLSQLNPVTFDYTTGYTELRGWDENRRICDHGFLAQEFETVFPQYVKCVEGQLTNFSGSTVSDFRTINSGHLIPVLVKAIQELEARIAVLESQ
jgi:hypothetical protein